MDIHAYPGQGLSLSQLVFALNEELKRVAYRSLFTFDAVSQLDQDTSTALTTIREWRNSFVSINRIPSEVLSLIPTHLPYEDLFCVSSVCRHWRKTFVQYAALWSQLNLTNKSSDLFVKTLLERAKGSPLDIGSTHLDRADILALLSPHAQQLRSLDLFYGYWSEVQKFSEAASGPLPLLHTLEIGAHYDMLSLAMMDSPSLPLFSGAVNLRRFSLRPEGAPFLNRFIFPNLTTFELSAIPGDEEFQASELLDFLEASPTLQTVCLRIVTDILLGDSAQRVVVLPNVQSFDLATHDGGSTYEFAARISCPSASFTWLALEKSPDDVVIDQDTFPTSASWNTIVHQYSRSPVKSVSLEIRSLQDLAAACSLTFRHSDMSIIGFGVEVPNEDGLGTPPEDIVQEIFFQASRAVQDHPLLSNIKSLCILYRVHIWSSNGVIRMANEVGRLFKSIGPLDELTLDGCHLGSYLTPFLGLSEFEDMDQPVAFPPVKKLTIAHPFVVDDEEEYMDAVVGLAKSQHALGVPFECVVVRMEKLPTVMAELLEPWVGEVRYHKELYFADYE